MNEIEQAVSFLLEQGFGQVDFGDPQDYDENDVYWANEFHQSWEQGGVLSRGQWYSFKGLTEALVGWTSEMEIELSRGFLLAVRAKFEGDPSAQASVDYLLEQM